MVVGSDGRLFSNGEVSERHGSGIDIPHPPQPPAYPNGHTCTCPTGEDAGSDRSEEGGRPADSQFKKQYDGTRSTPWVVRRAGYGIENCWSKNGSNTKSFRRILFDPDVSFSTLAPVRLLMRPGLVSGHDRRAAGLEAEAQPLQTDGDP